MGNVKGPGLWQFDLSLTRTFPVREMQKVEFRAEAFNVLNNVIVMNPTFDLNSNLFGKVTGGEGSSNYAVRAQVFFLGLEPTASDSLG